MKKIIGGKKYDTETAELVGEYGPDGLGPRDFEYFREALYRKRTGEYFLFGEGGPRSRYAQPYGVRGSQGGWAFEPVSYEAARAWAEEHLGADDYEAEFGDVSDEGDDVAMTVRVPASTKAAIDRESARTGETRGQVVARLAAAL